MHRSSSNAKKHPYLLVRFWNSNLFYEAATHSEKSRTYFRRWLQDINEREKVNTRL